MKASDLRIGNYIQDKKDREVQIIQVAFIGEGTINYWMESVYQPIPLSSEWLERFGRIEWLSHDIDGYFFWFNGEKKYLKFLHSLQNVYFAIETKELCFDTKTQNT